MHWIAVRPTPDVLPAPQTELAPPQAPTLADALAAWAWHALQFTPLVAQVDGVLVLEVSSSERLFGGRHHLLQQLFKSNTVFPRVECAQAATSLIAIGRLLAAQPTAAPDALPLHTLASARPHAATLARLGLRTWGQLRALPRGGLVRRFGAGLVDALDRAYGHAPEVYPWLTVPEVFDVPLELIASVEAAPALLFGARRLLAQLQLWLRARQQGVLALELRWDLDARRANAQHVDAHHNASHCGRLLLRTAQPTQDMVHLERLLAEQLARVTLPAPVLHLHLRSVQTQPMAGDSASLLPDDVRHGDSLHQLLERLSARLGPQQVLRATLQASHQPEHMQHWNPATATGVGCTFAIKSIAACAHPSGVNGLKGLKNGAAHTSPGAAHAAYPTWLLPTPQRLVVQLGQPQYHGALTLLAGPQRIEAGWLQGDANCALRDYFVARSPGAGLVWVYRERLPPHAHTGLRWYLHGLFA